MKRCFAYIRVSTAKQGEQGVSLQEQRDAIARFAERSDLQIVGWFEERETAAKRGRPIFTQMLAQLKKGGADSIIIHKIDRSARNLRDWADLGELIDHGTNVYFVNESLDLHSRGGRLSADIQAVVAADYIRNLREETRKGFYGRLKQGLYPLPAPIGYLDQGKGKAKTPDPVRAPLVRKAFELYAGGKYDLISLGEEMFRLGLRNRTGKKVSRTGLSVMLNNPFYIGLIQLRRSGETFPGIHQPIVKVHTFKQVESLLRGKAVTVSTRHAFQFRRFLKCRNCGYSLTGEKQKGHVYYRCHSRNCPMRTIREEEVSEQVRRQIMPLQFTRPEKDYIRKRVTAMRYDWQKQYDSQSTALELALKAIDNRLDRLTDVYLDQAIDRELFDHKKAALLLEKKRLEERLSNLKSNPGSMVQVLEDFLELAGSAYLRHEMALPDEKRDLLKDLTSNCVVDGKDVSMELNLPFNEVAERMNYSNGAPFRDRPRTFSEKGVQVSSSKELSKVWDPLIVRLLEMLSKEPMMFKTKSDSGLAA